MKKYNLLLGAHISIAGGAYKAFERGSEIGCTAIQIFTKSNRQWNAKPLQKKDIELFIETQKNQTAIKSIVVHAGYLINIASSKKEIYEKSKEALKQELYRAQQLEIPYLILHPGTCQNMPELESLKQIAATCDEIFANIPGSTKIVFETMAGQGNSIAYTLEQISTIIKNIKNKDRVGVCVDTCHIFAAGYDIRTPTMYKEFWNEFEKIIGIQKLMVLHLNDSKKDCGQRTDRHEFIGKGKLGLEPFKLIMNDERFFNIPKILETPVEKETEYSKDIQTLKKLISPETKKTLNL